MTRRPRLTLATLAPTWLLLFALPVRAARAQASAGRAPARLTLPAAGINLPMDDFGGRPVVAVRVNGRPCRFILDTGAQGSVIDSTLAVEVGLPVIGQQRVGSPGGRAVVVSLVHVDTLDVGGAAAALDLPALDLAAMLRGAPDAPRGVLSAALFTGNLLTLDFPARRVRAQPGSLGEANGRDILGFDPGERLPTVPVTVADRTLVVDLDTGSPASVALPLAYADSLPLAAPPARAGTSHRAGGEMAIYSARLNGRLTIGPLTLENPEITFTDAPATIRGNVGQQLLSRMVITLDRARGRVRLELPPTPPGTRP